VKRGPGWQKLEPWCCALARTIHEPDLPTYQNTASRALAMGV